ncbi:hypothetical protein TRP8649_03546 [Pelagimonas phthalicica]|uniref:DUF1963 domain-containing protein n=1 Tax=Pelagimonas phthalicica TaxID=1037362 RepID=A0A238JHI1_9RHOB|nr:DUF1963 domain-containing protein [Pelagimonas phthalicica]TDS92351.1 uncharacterized protein DUF1963 [Pelagimonas phthalicica]SMX29412.1 hypothetical protein TRP8649_03546 [Pelagimonas phthalicica]
MRNFLNAIFGAESIRKRSKAQGGTQGTGDGAKRFAGPHSKTAKGTSDPRPAQSGADVAEAFLARAGNESRAKEIPAWALLLHSPFDPPENPQSWIGGVPKAPPGFDWPRHPDGTRQHFLAQIDLAALGEGAGLPKSGALLIFLAYSWSDNAPDHGYCCKILSEEEMQVAVEQPIPDDLAPLDERMAFFTAAPCFPKRGVDLVAFLDDGQRPPKGVPYAMNKPDQWLRNWGLAAEEAAETMRHFDSYLRGWLGAGGKLKLDELQDRMTKMPQIGAYRTQFDEALAFRDHGPELLEALAAWRDHAAAQPPLAPVDPEALRAHFVQRAGFASNLKPSSDEVFGQNLRSCLLEGSHLALWEGIDHMVSDPEKLGQINEIYRDFAETYATGWRNHRLFGIEPEFPNNSEDRRGQDSVISIASDALLGTQCEHFYGVSIWCRSEDIAQGALGSGQVIRHCAV